jgi:PAS domain S-box-containing protein
MSQSGPGRSAARMAAERFAAVLRAASDYSIIGTDPQGLIAEFNAGAERMLGYRADEVVGKATPLLIHDPAEVASRATDLGLEPGLGIFVDAARDGKVETREWTYIRKDRERLRVSLTVTAMRDVEGTLTGFMGIARDITGERQVEATLDRLRLQYESILNAAGEGIIGIDRQGQATFVNPAAAAMTGYDPQDLVGQPVHELLHHTTAEGTSLASDQCACLRVLTEGSVNRVVDEVFWRKDGSSFPVEYVTAPIRENGAVTGAVVVFQDASSRKRTEDEVRLLSTVLLAIGETDDLDAALRTALREVCHATGWALGQAWILAEDGAHLTWTSARYVAGNGALAERLRPFLQASETVKVQSGQGMLGIAWSSRRPVWVPDVSTHPQFLRREAARQAGLRATLAVPVLAAGTPVAVLEFFLFEPRQEDERQVAIVAAVAAQLGVVIERKQAETERARLLEAERLARTEAERLKDEFLANVSHDLRTPVAAVKASIGVILANEPPGTPEPLHRLLVNIDLASDRMVKLVSDLLELTRLQADRVRLERDWHDLRLPALRASRSIEALAQAKAQQLDLALPNEPVMAPVDAGRLEQVLLNLLGNAHQYGRASGTIGLRLEQRSDEAIFSVSDDGPGICEADQARLFERFYRVDRSRSTQGSGLGLAISRSIVLLHGGRIWFESAPGAGTTIHVALPLHQQAQEPADDGRRTTDDGRRTTDDRTEGKTKNESRSAL